MISHISLIIRNMKVSITKHDSKVDKKPLDLLTYLK